MQNNENKIKSATYHKSFLLQQTLKPRQSMFTLTSPKLNSGIITCRIFTLRKIYITLGIDWREFWLKSRIRSCCKLHISNGTSHSCILLSSQIRCNRNSSGIGENTNMYKHRSTRNMQAYKADIYIKCLCICIYMKDSSWLTSGKALADEECWKILDALVMKQHYHSDPEPEP